MEGNLFHQASDAGTAVGNDENGCIAWCLVYEWFGFMIGVGGGERACREDDAEWESGRARGVYEGIWK